MAAIKSAIASNAYLFSALLVYTLGGASALINLSLNGLFEYAGLLMLLIRLLILEPKYRGKAAKYIIIFALILVLSSGLLLQSLMVSTILRLGATNVFIVLIALNGAHAFTRIDSAEYAAYGALAGVYACLVLSLLTGDQVVSGVGESGPIGFGLNFGMESKNFPAVISFAVMQILILICITESMSIIRIVAIIGGLFAVATAESRATLILCAVFFGCAIYFFVYKQNEKSLKLPVKKLITVIGVLVVILGILAGILFVMHSETYAYRARGLFNYIRTFGDDLFHMLFGNVHLAYEDPRYGYEEAIRRATGWDGTLELSLLSVLIKNGAIGLVAYALIIFIWIDRIRLEQNSWSKGALVSLALPLAVSAFVENYIVNVNIVYMPLVLISMWAISQDVRMSKNRKAKHLKRSINSRLVTLFFK